MNQCLQIWLLAPMLLLLAIGCDSKKEHKPQTAADTEAANLQKRARVEKEVLGDWQADYDNADSASTFVADMTLDLRDDHTLSFVSTRSDPLNRGQVIVKKAVGHWEIPKQGNPRLDVIATLDKGADGSPIPAGQSEFRFIPGMDQRDVLYTTALTLLPSGPRFHRPSVVKARHTAPTSAPSVTETDGVTPAPHLGGGSENAPADAGRRLNDAKDLIDQLKLNQADQLLKSLEVARDALPKEHQDRLRSLRSVWTATKNMVRAGTLKSAD